MQNIYKIRLVDNRFVRFVNTPITITIEPASIGWHVVDTWESLSGNNRTWHPTYNFSLNKVKQLVGHYCVTMPYDVERS